MSLGKDSTTTRGVQQVPEAVTISRRSLLRTGGGYLALQAVAPRLNLLAASPARSQSSASVAKTAAPVCLASSRTSYPPLLDRFIAKLDPATDVFPIEVYVVEIEKLLAGWSAEFRGTVHSLDAMRTSLSGHVRASSLRPSKTMALRTAKPLQVERRFFATEIEGREKFLESYAEYLSPFASVETAEYEIYGLRVVSGSPLVVDTEIHYDLVGTCVDKTREQRVGTSSIGWARDQSGAWTVQHWTANTETRSRLTGKGFTGITQHCLAADTPAMAQLNPGIEFSDIGITGIFPFPMGVLSEGGSALNRPAVAPQGR